MFSLIQIQMATYRKTYSFMYIHIHFLALSADSVAAAHLAPRYFLISLPSKRNQGPLEKWLILGLGQEIHNMSLEHLVVPVRKCSGKKHNYRSINK